MRGCARVAGCGLLFALSVAALGASTPAAAGAAETGVLLLEQRWATAGRQVPLTFTLALPRAAFPAAGEVLLRSERLPECGIAAGSR